MTDADLVIRNGRVLDGTGRPSRHLDIAVRDGRIVEMAPTVESEGAARVVDASGKWVTPGFIDIHTHYDAEVLVAPTLGESVRHGVTTVMLGSCSLSTVYASDEDCADLFSRVEAVPRAHVLEALARERSWAEPEGYAAALDALPLGPNVAAFIGHSDIRAVTMGLGRSVDPEVRPSRSELAAMRAMVEASFDAGFVGLSTSKCVFDKLDGDRFRSRQLPSVYAKAAENRRLYDVPRRRGRVLQALPDVTALNGLFGYLWTSTGIGRRSLKMSLLAAADAKMDKRAVRTLRPISRLVNGAGRGDFRWQHLPVPFEVYADGMDLVVFEEMQAGGAALHLADEAEREALLEDPDYRAGFRREYDKRFAAGVWHRNFGDAEIVDCPDAALIGRSIGAVAEERGRHAVDVFLDLVIEHGRALRWKTTLANHRREWLDRLATDEGVQIGFSDAGAHLRNMAFYNIGLRLLRRVQVAEEEGTPFMSPEAAVHRLSGELADWYDLDTGRLAPGERADLVVIDPDGLDGSVHEYHEASIPEFGGLSRMVRRNDRAVAMTVVGGHIVYEGGTLTGEAGGRFLRAGVDNPAGRADTARTQGGGLSVG